MSAQNRPEGIEPNLSREIRAHARADRQRVRAQLRPGVVLDDELDDPGVGYRKPHHRWHERGPRRVPLWKLRRQKLRRSSRLDRAA